MTYIDQTSLRRHRLNNLLHSVLLLGGMTLVLCLLGWMLMGSEGVVWAFFIGLFTLALSPSITPQAILRLYGARKLQRAEAPALYHVVQIMAQRAALPAPPELYYVPSKIMNAFAVGKRGQSAIAVSDGLLRALNLREIAGVLAHELGHIRHNDMWIMGLADVISRITSGFSFIGQILLFLNLPLLLFSRHAIPWLPILLLLFAPTLSGLLQLALSRTREFDADMDAARISGDPAALASALRKMERYQGNLLERLFIPGSRVPHPSVLRTHPDTEERIRRLLELTEVQETPVYQEAEQGRQSAAPQGVAQVSRRPRWRPTGIWH